MSESISRKITRRTAVTSAVAAIGASAGVTYASAQDSTPVDGQSSGEWSFTDDKGVTTTLPSQPERLVIDVNAAAPLWDFGIRPDALFGWNVLADGTLGDAGGNIDPEGIALVGDVNQPVNIEELIVAEPDVIITLTWTPDDPNDYWSMDAEALPQVQEVAPIIAMSATGRADENTTRFAELAAALGADLETKELVEAEQAFNDAIAHFGQVASGKSDLSVLFFAPITEEAYIANPGDWADLNMYQELGLSIVKPDAADGDFWEAISHEQALKYPSDVIFYSTRNEAFAEQEIKDSASWGSHPAVQDGQIFGWNQDFIQSYQGMTEALTAIADAVESSSKIL